jgi:hypothetical protein
MVADDRWIFADVVGSKLKEMCVVILRACVFKAAIEGEIAKLFATECTAVVHLLSLLFRVLPEPAQKLWVRLLSSA